MKNPARVAAVAAAAALTLTATTVPALASLSPAPMIPLTQSGVPVVWPSPGNTTPEATIPDSVQGRALTSLAADGDRAVAVTADGRLVSWGVSDASFFGAHTTTQPAGLDDIAAVAISGNTGAGNILALRSDGTLVAWGSTRTGINDIPSGLGRVVSIALTSYEAFAVKSDGTVVAWGNILADPPPVGLTGVVSLSVSSGGGREVLALKSDHTVVAWGGGGNAGGQQTIPAAVQDHAVAVRASAFSGLALLDDGSLLQWGNTLTTPPAPTAGDPYVDADLSGAGCGIAATQAGHVVTWGQSYCGLTPPAGLAGQHAVAVALDSGPNTALVLVSRLAVGAPPVVAGTAKSGQTLTLTDATFSGSPEDVSTQWLANGDPIDGATGDTLSLTDHLVGKTIAAAQTATQGDDTVTATSDPTGPVAPLKAATALKAAARATAYGTPTAITVTATPASATGTVQLKNGATVIGTATLVGGHATAAVPGTALAPGSHRLTVAYSGDANDAAASTAVALSVTKANAAAKTKISPKKLTKAKLKKAKATTTITATGYAPTGTVQIYLKKKLVATATLSNGKATLKLKKLVKLAKKSTKLKLQTRYTGDTTTNPTTVNTTLKLKH